MIKKNITIEDCIFYASKHNGRCLSQEYHDLIKIEWKCENDAHPTWLSRYKNIYAGCWCPSCGIESSSKNRMINTDSIRRHVLNYGIEWVGPDAEYDGINSKLSFKKIECGHEFKRGYNKVKLGFAGCPTCGGWTGENTCREIFNKTFNVNFEKVRSRLLPWLKNEDGHAIELDGYNEQLKIAFEYGNHRENTRWINENTKQNDKAKSDLCKKHGVKLFKIKEGKSDVIWKQIVEQSMILCIVIPRKHIPKIDLIKVYASESRKYWDKALAAANSIGFEIISKDNGRGSIQVITKKCMRGHLSSSNLSCVISNNIKCRQCVDLEKAIKTFNEFVIWRKRNKAKTPSAKSKDAKEKRYGQWIAFWTKKKKIGKIYPELLQIIKDGKMDKLFDAKGYRNQYAEKILE